MNIYSQRTEKGNIALNNAEWHNCNMKILIFINMKIRCGICHEGIILTDFEK